MAACSGCGCVSSAPLGLPGAVFCCCLRVGLSGVSGCPLALSWTGSARMAGVGSLSCVRRDYRLVTGLLSLRGCPVTIAAFHWACSAWFSHSAVYGVWCVLTGGCLVCPCGASGLACGELRMDVASGLGRWVPLLHCRALWFPRGGLGGSVSAAACTCCSGLVRACGSCRSLVATCSERCAHKTLTHVEAVPNLFYWK